MKVPVDFSPVTSHKQSYGNNTLMWSVSLDIFVFDDIKRGGLFNILFNFSQGPQFIFVRSNPFLEQSSTKQ